MIFIVAAQAADPALLREQRRSLEWVGPRHGIAALQAEGTLTDTVGDATVTWTFDDGLLFPIFAGRDDAEWKDFVKHEGRKALPAERLPRTAVGFVFVGNGRMALTLPDVDDRRRIAHQRAARFGDDVDLWTPVVEGAPLDVAITQGVWMTADPSMAKWLATRRPAGPAERPIVVGSDHLVSLERKAFEEAEDDAHELFAKRMALSDDPVQAWVRRDRVEPGPPHWFADVQTDTRWGHVRDRAWKAASRPGDQWLRWTRHDTTGSVITSGLDEGGRKVFATLAELGTLAPPLEPVQADTTIFAQLSDRGFHLEVDVRAKWTVRANRPVQVVELGLPDDDASEGTYSFVGATVAGTDVVLDPPQTRSTTDRRWLRVVFPEPLPAGQQATIKARWTGSWPYADKPGVMPQYSSGLRRLLPVLPDQPPGAAWSFTTTLAVPTKADLDVVVSGDVTREWADDSWRYRKTSGNAPWVGAAIGDWVDRGDATFSAHLAAGPTSAEIDRVVPSIRRVLGAYNGYLPPWTQKQLHLFQGRAPRDPVSPLQLVEVAGDPHPRELARLIAQDWWGHVARPATRQDLWMARTFAELYAIHYLGQTFGTEAQDAVLDAKQRRWESELFGDAPLTSAFAYDVDPERTAAIVDDYGPWVFYRILRPRLGDETFYKALDVFLRVYGEDATTDQLQRVFEQAAETELDDFFATWVHGGFIPDHLTCTWTQDGTVVEGTVTAPLPFSTIQVPVAVDDELVTVEVVNGEGAFRLEVEGPVRKVAVDPQRRVLTRARRTP